MLGDRDGDVEFAIISSPQADPLNVVGEQCVRLYEGPDVVPVYHTND